MSQEAQEETRLRLLVKKELRKRMRGVRKTMPTAALLERSERIVTSVAALPAWASAESVALFWPMTDRNEVDLRRLAARARAEGKRVAYPRVDTELGDMELRFVDDDTSLEEGPMGAMGASLDAPLAGVGEVDLIVVPALAVDAHGHRIGYGGGFYDRLLPRHASSTPFTVVVAFDFQLVVEVPTLETDVAVTHVITDRRSFAAGSPIDLADMPEAVASSEGVHVIPRRPREPRET